MIFTNAQYVLNEVTQQNEIRVTINGLENIFLPIHDDNIHYRELKKQVDAGTVTIAEAE